MFRDRIEAGRHLGLALADHAGPDVVVVGLPRGGMPVAAQVARTISAPLDVLLVRKLGAPHQPELALGAVGEGGVRVLNARVLDAVGASAEELAYVEAVERIELERRARRYRGERSALILEGRDVIIVDDGIATGSTVRAGCQVARARGARRLTVATPVAPSATINELVDDADEVVCLEHPEPFYAIGQFYDDFSPTSDDEVVAALEAR